MKKVQKTIKPHKPRFRKTCVGGRFFSQFTNFKNMDKLKPIAKTSHPNAEIFKYENSRVCVMSLPTNDYAIQLKTLSEDHTTRALHRVDRNKIVVTGIRISREAAISIMIGLQEQLRKDGVL